MLPAAILSLALACVLLFLPALPELRTLAWLIAGGAGAAWLVGGVRWLGVVMLAGLVAWRVTTVASATVQDRWPERLSGTDVIVAGSICDFPRRQAGSVRFVLETHAAQRPASVPRRILVTWYDGAAFPAPGQAWRLHLRLKPPRGLLNPGGFDFERWLFAERIGATGWVRDDPANTRLPDTAGTCPVSRLRGRLARSMTAGLQDRAATPYLLGLTVGAYQALPEDEWEQLRRTGTVHLVSISGFHLALVAGPCAWLGLLAGRALLAAGISCRPRSFAAATGALVATFYGLLAGFSVPTARSVVMLTVVALMAGLRRTPGPACILATVLVVLLVIEPLAPLVPGFWLSFAGVMALVCVASRLERRRPRADVTDSAGVVLSLLTRIWRPVRALIFTQAAMTVGLAPLLILFFGQLPLAGALANLVAVPAFSLVLVPLSLLAAGVAAVSPASAVPVLGLAADCVDLWRAFVAACAGLPAAVWLLPAPATAAVALGLAGVGWSFWPSPWPCRFLGLLFLCALLPGSMTAVPSGGVRVTVIDVGQGLAVLVETAHHALLYDAGPAYRGSDAGERAVVPVLQARNLRQLDVLMISHGDADHRGGAASVLGARPEARLLGSPVARNPGQPCTAGTHWQWDGVGFAVLHPGPSTPTPAEDNASSCVLLVKTSATAVLLPGDIEADVERQLVAAGAFRRVDLVVVPHHGSRTSSSGEFVSSTTPRFAAFSTGFANRWHFPAGEVAKRWRQAGACLLNTAEEGALQFDAAPGQPLRLGRRERAEAPGVWLARPPASAACR